MKFFKKARLFFGIVFSPFDALWGLFKGFHAWATESKTTGSPFSYFYAALKDRNPSFSDTLKLDRDGKTSSGAYGYARIAGVGLAVVCVLGFVGAIACPLPGVTPLYTAAITPILKAIGLTTLYSTLGRLCGALVGAVQDTIRYKIKLSPLLEEVGNDLNVKERERINKQCSSERHILKALLLGLGGEKAAHILMKKESTSTPSSPDISRSSTPLLADRSRSSSSVPSSSQSRRSFT